MYQWEVDMGWSENGVSHHLMVDSFQDEHHNWLVVSPPLKNMNLRLDHHPNLLGKTKAMFQTTNQINWLDPMETPFLDSKKWSFSSKKAPKAMDGAWYFSASLRETDILSGEGLFLALMSGNIYRKPWGFYH